MVTVKPISRWQVWLGKWLGILGLNAMLLMLSGAAIFILLQWRAGHLPPDEQKVLRDEIFVARASIKERAPDLKRQIDQKVQQRIAELEQTELTELDKAEIRKQVTEEVKAASTGVPPGYGRLWVIDLHTLPARTQNEAFQVRVKFHASDPNPDATYDTYWVVGPPDSPRVAKIRQVLPPDSFQEFQVPPHLLDEKGRLIIDFYNANDASLMFPIEDGFELLYYENSFGVNFIRGFRALRGAALELKTSCQGKDMANFVLSKFETNEIPEVEKMVRTAADAVFVFINEGIETAMNKFN